MSVFSFFGRFFSKLRQNSAKLRSFFSIYLEICIACICIVFVRSLSSKYLRNFQNFFSFSDTKLTNVWKHLLPCVKFDEIYNKNDAAVLRIRKIWNNADINTRIKNENPAKWAYSCKKQSASESSKKPAPFKRPQW